MRVTETFIANSLVHTVIESLLLRLRQFVGWLAYVAGSGFGFVGSDGDEGKGETGNDNQENTHVSRGHRAKHSG